MRAADHKPPRRIDINRHIRRKQFPRHGLVNHFFHYPFPDCGEGYALVMLGGNDNGINTYGPSVFIAHGHLCFSVRTQKAERPFPARGGQPFRQFVRIGNWHRHTLRRLVAGVTEHHALVARANIKRIGLLRLPRTVDAERNIRRLLVNRGDNPAGFRVKSQFTAVVSDICDDAARNPGNIHIPFCRNFAHHQHQTGRHRRLAGDTRVRILPQHVVKHCVRNLVAYFIRMPLRY